MRARGAAGRRAAQTRQQPKIFAQYRASSSEPRRPVAPLTAGAAERARKVAVPHENVLAVKLPRQKGRRQGGAIRV